MTHNYALHIERHLVRIYKYLYITPSTILIKFNLTNILSIILEWSASTCHSGGVVVWRCEPLGGVVVRELNWEPPRAARCVRCEQLCHPIIPQVFKGPHHLRWPQQVAGWPASNGCKPHGERSLPGQRLWTSSAVWCLTFQSKTQEQQCRLTPCQVQANEPVRSAGWLAHFNAYLHNLYPVPIVPRRPSTLRKRLQRHLALFLTTRCTDVDNLKFTLPSHYNSWTKEHGKDELNSWT